MKNSIKENMDKVYNETEDLSQACKYSQNENGNLLYGTTNCYEISYKLLQKSIDNNTILFITDNDGSLNILPILYNDNIQTGDSNHYLIKVKKQDQ